jgi:aspartyl-tRNA(Asn)/glutamyl-tRNA(Gln) amidotransferase subunit C
MVAVNDALTRQVAQLARLELSDLEVATFTSQLGEIIGYIDLLQKVDVARVAPMTHPLELATSFREDEVAPLAGDVVSCAPETVHGGFKVPPIL